MVVASNRLPVTISAPGASTPSPGGLVAAVEPALAGRGGAWVGWPGEGSGGDIFEGDGDITCVPVPLSADDVRNHYEGYSNSTIWPLFHDVGVPHDYAREWWDSYVAVNQAFATRVSTVASPGATVWIHDYHLMLAPEALRAHRADVALGYFHHIPFPGAELLAKTHHAEALVVGLLGCDLIGFQRRGDADNFLECVRTFLPDATISGTVVTRLHDGAPRVTTIGVFPISIDFEAVDVLASSVAVGLLARDFRSQWGNPQTVFLGVDRIDYTKGIPERLEAFERLLETGALSVNDVVFVQAGSPSREAVEQYQQLAARVMGLVERINARFQAPSGRPAVIYLAENLPRETMIALFVAADVMVVSSLADGMNLVAKEFIAARTDNTGVLVLSSRAGAADELTEALLVDPTDIDAVARAMLEASSLDSEVATASMGAMRERVRVADVRAWSEAFLVELARRSSERGD